MSDYKPTFELKPFKGKWHVVWYDRVEIPSTDDPTKIRVKYEPSRRSSGYSSNQEDPLAETNKLNADRYLRDFKKEAGVEIEKATLAPEGEANLTVAEVIDIYASEQFGRAKYLKHIKQTIGHVKISDLCHDDIEQYEEYEEALGNASGTIFQRLQQLQAAMTWVGVRRKHPLKIKVFDIRTDHKPGKRDLFIPHSEINKFLDTFHPVEDVWCAIATAAYFTLGRVGALIQLRLDNINELACDLNTSEPLELGRHRRKRRAVLFSTAEILALRNWAVARGHRTHLIEVDGEPVTYKKVQERMFEAADRADLPHITMHYIRHAAASHLQILGASKESGAESMGHANTKLFEELYGKHHPARTIDAMSKLSNEDNSLSAENVKARIDAYIRRLGGPVLLPAMFQKYLPKHTTIEHIEGHTTKRIAAE